MANAARQVSSQEIGPIRVRVSSSLWTNQRVMSTTRLSGWRNHATAQRSVRVMRERASNDKSSDVMDIGEIDSVDYTPDYSERDTFVEMVSFYSGDKISKQQDKIKKATERMTKSLAPQPVPVKRTEPINNPSKIDISIPKFGATNERTDSN